MTNQPAERPCGCCTPQESAVGGPAAVREQILTATDGLGMTGDDQSTVLELVDAGDCRAVRDHMAAHVAARLSVAEQAVASVIGRAATTHRNLAEMFGAYGPVPAGAR